jgi:hypothetical protein
VGETPVKRIDLTVGQIACGVLFTEVEEDFDELLRWRTLHVHDSGHRVAAGLVEVVDVDEASGYQSIRLMDEPISGKLLRELRGQAMLTDPAKRRHQQLIQVLQSTEESVEAAGGERRERCIATFLDLSEVEESSPDLREGHGASAVGLNVLAERLGFYTEGRAQCGLGDFSSHCLRSDLGKRINDRKLGVEPGAVVSAPALLLHHEGNHSQCRIMPPEARQLFGVLRRKPMAQRRIRIFAKQGQADARVADLGKGA